MLFKMTGYKVDHDEDTLTFKRPTFLEAEDMQDALDFASRVVGVQDTRLIFLSSYVGRLPLNAVVLNRAMTFEELYGEGGLHQAC